MYDELFHDRRQKPEQLSDCYTPFPLTPQAVVGSIVWAFQRLNNPRSREMSVCPKAFVPNCFLTEKAICNDSASLYNPCSALCNIDNLYRTRDEEFRNENQESSERDFHWIIETKNGEEITGIMVLIKDDGLRGQHAPEFLLVWLNMYDLPTSANVWRIFSWRAAKVRTTERWLIRISVGESPHSEYQIYQPLLCNSSFIGIKWYS